MTATDPTEKQSTPDAPVHGMRRDARREILGEIALKREAQADAIVRMASGEFTSDEERDTFRSGLAYAGGKTVRLDREAGRQAQRELKRRRPCEKLLHDRWLGTVWLSDTYRCGTGHRATRPGQGRIEVGISGLDWNRGTSGVPSAASDATVVIEVTGPTGDDGEPRSSVTVRMLPGEALELAALLTRSTRKLEKRQG